MQGTYELHLVLLSIVVAMAASFGALDLAGRVTSAPARTATLWLGGGALIMGAGIWSMHFIGMLAFKLPVRMAYQPLETGISMVTAVITSGFALNVVSRLAVVSRTDANVPVLVAGGAIMGGGIAGMHYTGMAAMRMAPPIVYDPLLFGASILIAVTASIVALWLAFMLRFGGSSRPLVFRLLAAVVMGLSIAGMHYTAMAAAQFDPEAICTVSSRYEVDNRRLAYAVAAAVLIILSLTVLIPMPAHSRGSSAATKQP